MKHSLVPGGSSGELTCKSFSKAATFADMLIEEGYVVMISREEDLYIVNYIWSEQDANRNDVVFMDRCDFDMDFCEIEEDEEEEDDLDYYKQQRAIRDAENSAWHVVAKLLSKSPEQIEEIFGVKTDDERTKFWTYYPDQLSFDDAKERLYQWDRKRMANTEEAVMQEAMKWCDIMDEEKVRSEIPEEYHPNE